MENDNLKTEQAKDNIVLSDVSGCLLTVKAVISTSIALGIQKYAKDFDCSLLSLIGCGEEWIEVTVSGSKENLEQLNEKAKSYKPTVVRSKDCR